MGTAAHRKPATVAVSETARFTEKLLNLSKKAV
jgi:hypothetical protein